MGWVSGHGRKFIKELPRQFLKLRKIDGARGGLCVTIPKDCERRDMTKVSLRCCFYFIEEGLCVFMKKFVLCALLLGLTVGVASPVLAWDAAKQKNLGQDHVKMTWYILDYGKNKNVPYAIARKYYTNAAIKEETIDLLMSKFGLSPEVAGSLYFTEYGYEYTPDGKQFAVTYLRHYDMLGNEIYGTVYDGSSEATKKTFAAVDPKHAAGKGASYALGKTPAASASKKAASPAKVKTSTKRVVRKKK